VVVSHFLGWSEGAEVRDGISAVSPSRRLVSVLYYCLVRIYYYIRRASYIIFILYYYFIAPGVRDSTRRQRDVFEIHPRSSSPHIYFENGFSPSLKHTVLAEEPKSNRTPRYKNNVSNVLRAQKQYARGIQVQMVQQL